MPKILKSIEVDLQDETPTPLELIVGFKVAEETYNKLNLRQQLILDLLIFELSRSMIAEILECSPSTVSMEVQRIRVKLANSKLKNILDLRTGKAK